MRNIGAIHHGEIFKKQIKAQNVQVQEISRYLGVSRGTLSKWMSSEKLKKHQIILLCHALDLKPSDFHSDKKVIDGYIPFGNLSKHLGYVDNTKFVKFGQDSNNLKDKSKFDEFFAVLNAKLGAVQNQVAIYEYLDMTSSPKLMEHFEFTEKSRSYLKEIEMLHKKKKVQYRRIFALPIDILERNPLLRTLKPEMKELNLNAYEIDIVCLLHLLFGLSIRHIGRCFKLFGERMHAYILHSTTVKYSFKLIDESSIAFHHARYGKYSNDVRPDFLHLHTVTETHEDPDIRAMIRSFTDVFTTLEGHALESETTINVVSSRNVQSGLTIFQNLIDMALIRHKATIERYQAEPISFEKDELEVDRLKKQSDRELTVSRLNDVVFELEICRKQLIKKARAFNLELARKF